MLESKFLERMLRLCQGNGNTKLDLVKVSKLETICGYLGFCFTDVLKSLNFQSTLSLNYSPTGMGLDVFKLLY
jgi:hypothetical protein